MYRRVSIQLLPLAPDFVPVPAASRNQKSVSWLLLAAAAAAALLLFGQLWQTRSLERQLVRDLGRAEAVQHRLAAQALAAGQRNGALEQDLRSIEQEAERLYDVVQAMRALGEQLRERVGLPGPVLEPMPELPPRPASRAEPATSISLASLPPDTGPWPTTEVRLRAEGARELGGEPPFALLAAPSAPAGRLHVAGEAIARQWELWQHLSQAIDARLGQRSRATRPSIRPAYGHVTSGFGRRPGFWGILATHSGIDVSLPIGTVVVVTADGTVTFAGARSGYGYTVEVQHEGGLLTLYGHLSRTLVRAGDRVSQGQVVALSGNSGMSTGPHLHYEVRLNGTPVDPRRYW
ncbi:MAG: M23 family metallopeptidase [Chloroflexota bacterium]